MKISEEVLDVELQLIKIRRHLHQIAQIGLQQYQTSAYIRQYLSSIQNIQVLDPLQHCSTAVIIKIIKQNAKQTYLYRCELDALGFKQQSGLQYSSKGNCHHACGHDAHMAAMLVSIKLISHHIQDLERTLIFCFQPGQEGKGGAQKLITTYPQILNNVKHCFAVHSANHMLVGEVALSDGPITTNSNRFTIDLHGRQCHPMTRHIGLDTNFIGCSLVTQLYNIAHLSLKMLGNLTITKVQGGKTGVSSVSGKFRIEGSLRVDDYQLQKKTKLQIIQTVGHHCNEYGMKYQLNITQDFYRTVVNSAQVVSISEKVLKQISCKLRFQHRCLAGEDFCQFSERVTSCYVAIGAAMPNSLDQTTKQSQFPLHSSKHQLDEKFLLLVTQYWLNLSLS